MVAVTGLNLEWQSTSSGTSQGKEVLGVLRVETEGGSVTQSPFSQMLRIQTGGLTTPFSIYEVKCNCMSTQEFLDNTAQCNCSIPLVFPDIKCLYVLFSKAEKCPFGSLKYPLLKQSMLRMHGNFGSVRIAWFCHSWLVRLASASGTVSCWDRPDTSEIEMDSASTYLHGIRVHCAIRST